MNQKHQNDDDFLSANISSKLNFTKIKFYIIEIMNDILIKSKVNAGFYKFLLIIEQVQLLYYAM